MSTYETGSTKMEDLQYDELRILQSLTKQSITSVRQSRKWRAEHAACTK
jgi:hypothetical protein